MKYYLTLLFTCFILPCYVIAQHPGGVSGNKLWLKKDGISDTLSLKKNDTDEFKKSHFNFNPVLNVSSIPKNFRNIVNKEYSLFVVFKSDFEEERSLITINRGKTKAIITNKELLNDTEIPYKINSGKGIILCYLNANNDIHGKKNNNLSFDELFAEDKEGKEQLIELIYYPSIVSRLQREKIETYLSIKYGISVLGDFDYMNSEGSIIWNIKENEDYNNRVTGIGRDDLLGLYQRQSGNSQKDGIYIGFGIVDTTNAHNRYTLKDKSFLLWGDNNGRTVFSQDNTIRLKKMERIWKMDSYGIASQDSITTQLKINKREFNYINKDTGNEFLWLSVNASDNNVFNYTGARYIKQSFEDDEFIYFNNISWDTDGSGADIFTFIQSPDFMAEHKENFTCGTENGIVTVKLIGGTLPYTLEFNGRELTTENDSIEFTDVQSGTYTLNAAESKGHSVKEDVEVGAFAGLSIALSPVWYLNTLQEVTIQPTTHTEMTGLTLEWISKGKTIATGKEFTTKNPGEYTLSVTSTEGCKKDIPFKVEGHNDSLPAGWKLYPNPVKRGEQFSIEFTLEKESQVSINISSMEGRQIANKDLGLIKDFVFRETLITSGVYLITLRINNTSETVKLIVH